jgi:hypothetical protein
VFQVPKGMLQTGTQTISMENVGRRFQVPKGMLQTGIRCSQFFIPFSRFKSPRECYKHMLLTPWSNRLKVSSPQGNATNETLLHFVVLVDTNMEVSSPQGNATNVYKTQNTLILRQKVSSPQGNATNLRLPLKLPSDFLFQVPKGMLQTFL